MVPYRLVLADDHFAFREVLKILLEKRKDLEVVAEADNGLELVNILN
jgi:DNA-binding NarL/FixJ family response regulator